MARQLHHLPHALRQALGLQPAPAGLDAPLYQGFVQEVAQTLQVWGLMDAGGWISLPLDDGASCLPVWSQPFEARAFARGAWAGCRPGAIDLPDFLDHWLPAMDQLGVAVAVQPQDVTPRVTVPARVLAWHLQVRCVSFPVPWSDGRPDRGSRPYPGEP